MVSQYCFLITFSDPDVSSEKQEEKGIEYKFQVYQQDI